jgi:hypothetical protein
MEKDSKVLFLYEFHIIDIPVKQLIYTHQKSKLLELFQTFHE